MADREKKAALYHKRIARGLTQTEYAKELRIHHVTLSRLENYLILPSEQVAKKIGPVIDMPWNEVIADYAKNLRRR